MKESTEKLLEQYCLMTGREKEEAVEIALQQFLGRYKAKDGEPKKATYLEGVTPYERKMAEIENREVEVKKIPCYVLEKTSMMGKPYYRIVVDGMLMSVPGYCVEFGEEK